MGHTALTACAWSAPQMQRQQRGCSSARCAVIPAARRTQPHLQMPILRAPLQGATPHTLPPLTCQPRVSIHAAPPPALPLPLRRHLLQHLARLLVRPAANKLNSTAQRRLTALVDLLVCPAAGRHAKYCTAHENMRMPAGAPCGKRHAQHCGNGAKTAEGQHGIHARAQHKCAGCMHVLIISVQGANSGKKGKKHACSERSCMLPSRT